MFDFIFDFSYERNIHESIVFYFSYVAFALYLWILAICILFFIVQDVVLRGVLIMVLTPFIPFVFYTSIAILLCIKKNYKDRGNIIFVISTILLTLLIPGLTGNVLGFILSPTPPKFTLETLVGGTIAGVLLFSLSELFLGCIPLAILSTRECMKDQSIMRKMTQERIKQEIEVERLLLMEQFSINDLYKPSTAMQDDKFE